MTIVISELERLAIEDYVKHPEKYMDDEHEKVLSENGTLPNGTKVSRPKGDGRRYYSIPGNSNVKPRLIMIEKDFPNDPKEHSATLLDDKLYYHQNKNDLPKKVKKYHDLQRNEDVFEDENKEPGEPDYTRCFTEYANSFYNRTTIKYAVDTEKNLFYYKSRMSSEKDTIISRPQPVKEYAPNLYMGDAVLRQTLFAAPKQITITKNAGENLTQFISRRGAQLSDQEKESLVKEILTQYLTQIYDQGIVHTDIKLENICVEEILNEEELFKITFIDFDESFFEETPHQDAFGTPGYMAREFFKTEESFRQQRVNNNLGGSIYYATLVDNHKDIFSSKTDIFALGTLILRDLSFPDTSQWYNLITKMCATSPEERATGELIRDVLEILDNKNLNCP